MTAPRPFKLGVTLPQFTDDPQRLLEGARRAEELGFDSLWLFDHLWPLSGGKERPIFECWTTLAFLAAETKSIGLGTLVTRSSLRHPALLVKMAATVASIAPGRLSVGIGSGDHLSRDENESFGIPYFAGDERVGQLDETVTVLKRSFEEGEITFDGDFVELKELPLSPVPPASPDVWVGGRSGDATGLAGRVADGWNGWGGDPRRFTQDAQEVLDAAAGRPVELTWGGLVRLDPGSSAALGSASPGGDPVISGAPEEVAKLLAGFVEAGASHLVVTLAGGWKTEDLVRLAKEIRPQIGV